MGVAGILVAAQLLPFAAPVAAEPVAPVTPTLQWSAPPTCPAAEQVRERVAALARPAGAPLAVRVAVEPGEAGFVATIELDDGDGTARRTVTAASCDALADAVAVIVAVASGRVETEPAAPQDPAPEPAIVTPREQPQPSAAADPTATPAAAPARTPAARRDTTSGTRGAKVRSRWGVAADAGLRWRTVPGVAPAIAIGVAWIGRGARVELRGVATTPTRSEPLPSPYQRVTATIHSGVVQARGSWVPQLRRLELPLGGGLELGALTASGRGGDRSRTRTAVLVALVAGAGLAWVPVPRVALRLDVAASFALVRPRFGVQTPGGVLVPFQTAWVGLGASAGIELRFGQRARTRTKVTRTTPGGQC